MKFLLTAVGGFLLITSGIHLSNGDNFGFWLLSICGALAIAGGTA